MKHKGGSIMLSGCFAAGETEALKTDGIMRKKNYLDIPEAVNQTRNLKVLFRKGS